MGGVFPLATSVLTLAVMFVILVRLDLTLRCCRWRSCRSSIVCLRYYSPTMTDRAERVKELESKLIERAFEIFVVDRGGQELRARAPRAEPLRPGRRRDDEARGSRSPGRSRCSRCAVTAITIPGTALVLVVGGLHVMRRHADASAACSSSSPISARSTARCRRSRTPPARCRGASSSARRVREMLALTPETLDAAGRHRRRRGIAGDVRVRATSASPTTTSRRILHDISFDAQPGEMVALVGLTGAGKTTLVSLIPRFFEPTARPRARSTASTCRDYALRSLRERIAIVLQEPVLFAGTIADNLRYGRLDATDDEVEAAARAAHAHEFISRLPKGYDTPVAEAGGDAVGRRAPAAEHRARDAEERADPDPRRADLVARRDLGGDRVRTRCAGCARAARRSSSRTGCRRSATPTASSCWTSGRIAAQGTHDELLRVERALPADVRAAVGRQVARRAGDGRRADPGGAGVKILFAGIIARYPFGGVTWCSLMYLLGLRALGHEVFYIEDTGECVYDPVQNTRSTDPSYGTDYIHDALEPFGLGDRWTLRELRRHLSRRVARRRCARFCADADLFINLSGGSWFWRDEYARDPAQGVHRLRSGVHAARDRQGRAVVRRVLPAASITCSPSARTSARRRRDVPTGGFTWHKTWQPVT